MDEPEEWRPILGAPDYEVSDLGRVRSRDRTVTRWHRGKFIQQPRRGKILAPGRDKKGYPQVVVVGPKGRFTRRVHILVAEAFLGPRPGTFLALHNDGDSGNPRLSNLRWGSPASNTADAMRMGTHYLPKGEAHGCAKLTEKDVLAIRNAPGGQRRIRALATRFGVGTMTIWTIRTRRSWRHLEDGHEDHRTAG